MFEPLGTKKPPSHRFALWGAILGGFALGLGTGKLLAGARPWDWVSTIFMLVSALFWTIWCAVIATRSETGAKN
jgi:hypothetical protein